MTIDNNFRPDLNLQYLLLELKSKSLHKVKQEIKREENEDRFDVL